MQNRLDLEEVQAVDGAGGSRTRVREQIPRCVYVRIPLFRFSSHWWPADSLLRDQLRWISLLHRRAEYGSQPDSIDARRRTSGPVRRRTGYISSTYAASAI